MEQQNQSVGIEPLVYVSAMTYHARRNDGNSFAVGGLIGKRTETGKLIITNCFPVKYTKAYLDEALKVNTDFDSVELSRLKEAISKKNAEIERVYEKKSEDIRGIEKEAAKHKAVAESTGLELGDDSNNASEKDREEAKAILDQLNEKKATVEKEAKSQADKKNVELSILKEKISNEEFFDFMFRISISTLSPEHQLVGWFSTCSNLDYEQYTYFNKFFEYHNSSENHLVHLSIDGINFKEAAKCTEVVSFTIGQTTFGPFTHVLPITLEEGDQTKIAMKYLLSRASRTEKGYFSALDAGLPISKEAKVESMTQLIEKTIEYIKKVLNGKAVPDYAFGRELTKILAEKKDHYYISKLGTIIRNMSQLMIKDVDLSEYTRKCIVKDDIKRSNTKDNSKKNK